MKKNALIIAFILIALGIVITFAVLTMVHFDPQKLNHSQFEENTYSVEEPFQNIQINEIAHNITFTFSENGKSEVTCTESEKIKTTVLVENNTLKIERNDTRRWYEKIGLFWCYNPKIIVSLPSNEYQNLIIETVSGNITISESFRFQEVSLKSTSGNIHYSSIVANKLDVKSTSGKVSLNLQDNLLDSLNVETTSGKITLSNVKSLNANIHSTSGNVLGNNIQTNNIYIKTTSGNIKVDEMNANISNIKTTSGKINLNNINVVEYLEVNSTSGDIFLNSSDALSILIKTVSGDVEASLLTPKNFITKTTSGKMNVPSSDSTQGVCNVTTTSGDINISVL